MSAAFRTRRVNLLRTRVVLTALGVVMIGATGCAGPAADAPSPAAGGHSAAVALKRATLVTGQPVPSPKDPVLTVTGKISTTNSGGSLQLDVPTLQRLALWRVRVYEPWVKQHLTFRGVWLDDLLRVAGAKHSARHLHAIALDEYDVTLPLDDIKAGGVLLATSTGDGSAIPIEDGGPTRIVFLHDAPANRPAQWIWSLKELQVR